MPKTRRRGGGLTTNHTIGYVLELLKNATEDEFNEIADIWNVQFPNITREKRIYFLFDRLRQNTSLFQLLGQFLVIPALVTNFKQIAELGVLGKTIQGLNLGKIYLLAPYATLAAVVLSAAIKWKVSNSEKNKSIKTANILDAISKRVVVVVSDEPKK